MSEARPQSIDDPRYVREQYASEAGLVARGSLYAETTGPSPGDVAFEAAAEVSPRRFLEVGCGSGWFAARVRDELEAEVLAVDQSERMVELARERGLDARVADVQSLPFDGEAFDVAAANWMLYHVPDLDRGLGELARVLRPGGRLVAITNGKDHLLELWRLAGAEEARAERRLPFGAENGEEVLRHHFRHVEIREAKGTVTIPDREAVLRYLASSDAWSRFAEDVPELVEPFVACRSTVVFVAAK